MHRQPIQPHWCTALLAGWMAMFGATPSLPAAETASVHWSFRPIDSPPLPPVAQAEWPRNPVDRFIQSGLEKAHLSPSPEADRRTLIRRLSFDLIGLPPSPEETEAFVQDPSPRAYENLVDRLLASPHHGECWARHWLDVVRYTESQGFEYDRLRDNAWHYRDYVIKSLNEDKPYDRFIQEQIAGDALTPVTRESLIGPSLLVCGAWDEAGNAQANMTQRMITREDEMEDLLGVVGQTFLGLTLNCARCHSHKFDPIPQTDYYRMKSVFDGVRHGERPIATPSEIQDRDLRIEHLKRSISTLEVSMAELENRAWRRAAPSSKPEVAATLALRPLERFVFDDSRSISNRGSFEGGAVVRDGRLELSGRGAFFRSLPISRDVREKTLEVWVSLNGLDQRGGAAISLEASGGSPFDAIVFGERQARRWMAGSEGFVRTKDLEVPEEDSQALTITHWVAVYREDNQVLLYRNGKPYGKPYTPGSPLQTYRAGTASLLLGKRHTGGDNPFLGGSIWEAALYDKALSPLEISGLFGASRFHIPREKMLAAMRPEESAAWQKAQHEIERLRAELGSVPPIPVSYAGVRKQPEATHKLKRGDVRSPEEVVTPGALSALPGPSPEFSLPADAPEAERRLRFAQWLTDHRNPLPARVIVNRLWQFHFGQGLVSTPNDFGRSGTAPSHPELLDWMAHYLMTHDWSLKSLHRLIVTSATYRQSSMARGEALEKDAENQWLWRYSPRRLESETLRDALLKVSGELNPSMGGPSVRPFEVLKFPANAYQPIDSPDPAFNRRTVYRMNVNSGKEPLLDAFDCPDPSVRTPRRGVTTTPLQALGMMNGSFVQRQATKLAARVEAEAGTSPEDRVKAAYRRALCRLPNPAELERSTAVLHDRGLFHLCWALLNSTEFLYVD